MIATDESTPVAMRPGEDRFVDELADRNLFGEADRIAARAWSPGRQYAAVYRTFADWLGSELGLPLWCATWTPT